MLYSYPLRAEYALQCIQWHILCAVVAPKRRQPPFRQDPARVICPTVHSVAHSLRRGMLYSHPLRAEYGLQCSQWHILCAGVPPIPRKLPFSRGPCARSMAYSAFSGTFSAQGYALQLPPARGVCPTGPSEAHSPRRGSAKTPKTAISRGPCAPTLPYRALRGTFPLRRWR